MYVIYLLVATLENHCTRTVQSSRGGCSRRVHKIVYLAFFNKSSCVWVCHLFVVVVCCCCLFVFLYIYFCCCCRFQKFVSLILFRKSVSLKSDKKCQEATRSHTKRQEDFISIIMQFYVCCIAKSIIFYMYKCLYWSKCSCIASNYQLTPLRFARALNY